MSELGQKPALPRRGIAVRFTPNCGLTDSDAGTALSFRVTSYAVAMRGAATNVVR
jgi:hypothetical protein